MGDHKIIEGTATLTFSNETSAPVILAVFGYETGSTALATELAVGEEGESFIPRGGLPAAGIFDVDIDQAGDLEPGSHTLTIDLRPGTYIFDAGPGDFMTTGLWRVAVIEVVAK